MLKYIMKRFEDYKFTRKGVKGTTVLPPALAQLVLRILGGPGRTSLRLNIGSRNSLANPKRGGFQIIRVWNVVALGGHCFQ